MPEEEHHVNKKPLVQRKGTGDRTPHADTTTGVSHHEAESFSRQSKVSSLQRRITERLAGPPPNDDEADIW
eukprot:CAMPEP_0178926504 /NCGR_PEP_ID=MMETSP0786-20121207/18577_1 /TAXON_ID=186022 /ORGANISM="Thalassionema frauenfeldii, Strain CCMP 1798" /LENGTH=70 /DNA_ID=CAMNT_0020601649 /DNA_START=46 /DNA_END=255 /DNA_ORIENTATION=+